MLGDEHLNMTEIYRQANSALMTETPDFRGIDYRKAMDAIVDMVDDWIDAGRPGQFILYYAREWWDANKGKYT